LSTYTFPRYSPWSFLSLRALAPPAPDPLSLHDALPICLGLRLLEPDQFDARLVELAVVRDLGLVVAEHVGDVGQPDRLGLVPEPDRKSTRLNSSHGSISYAVFCLKKKRDSQQQQATRRQ